MDTQETIVSILDYEKTERYEGMSGFEVVTTKQTIKLAINNHQDCCEDWGFFWSNDIPNDFIGAHVRGVSITDTALNTEKVPDVYEGGVMFVNIDTDLGVLQFVAYNSHNGYYGHTAKVECEQLKHEETL